METVYKKNKKPKVGFFRTIRIYYKKHLFHFLSILTFTLLSSACTVITPKIVEQLINPKTLANNDIIKILTYSLSLVGLFIGSGIFQFIQSAVGGRLARKIEIGIRNELLCQLLDLDMSFYHNKKIGEILTKLISDTQIVGDNSQQIPASFLSAFVTFFGSIAMLFTISWKLTLITLVATIAIFIFMIVMFRVIKAVTYKVRKTLTSINGNVTDRISSISLIKSSATESYEKQHFANVHNDYYKQSKKQSTLNAFVVAVMITTLSSLNIIVLISGVILMRTHHLIEYTSSYTEPAYISESVAVIIPFVMGMNILVMPILTLVRTFNNLASASTSVVRINDLMEVKPLIDVNENGEIINAIDGNIIFKDISFAYPNALEKTILKNFNYEFAPGKSYAFVGETGVGKSTISKLLLRYYDPTSGTILINYNKPLNEVNLKSYLSFVGYVEQEPQILFGTFFDNIRYGKFDATDEEVYEACKKAELHNFIESLPNKYDTLLGEKGFILSGGQKQRLVIARMFLKNPQLLILDEATSALDNIVEKEIQANLDHLKKGRTTFIIAHRLSTIKNVDKILVLEKDKGVVQTGTFNELKKIEGRFKNLYEAGLID